MAMTATRLADCCVVEREHEAALDVADGRARPPSTIGTVSRRIGRRPDVDRPQVAPRGRGADTTAAWSGQARHRDLRDGFATTRPVRVEIRGGTCPRQPAAPSSRVARLLRQLAVERRSGGRREVASARSTSASRARRVADGRRHADADDQQRRGARR